MSAPLHRNTHACNCQPLHLNVIVVDNQFLTRIKLMDGNTFIRNLSGIYPSNGQDSAFSILTSCVSRRDNIFGLIGVFECVGVVMRQRLKYCVKNCVGIFIHCKK